MGVRRYVESEPSREHRDEAQDLVARARDDRGAEGVVERDELDGVLRGVGGEPDRGGGDVDATGGGELDPEASRVARDGDQRLVDQSPESEAGQVVDPGLAGLGVTDEGTARRLDRGLRHGRGGDGGG